MELRPCPICGRKPKLLIEWIAPALYVKYYCRRWWGLRACFDEARLAKMLGHSPISAGLELAAKRWNDAVSSERAS